MEELVGRLVVGRKRDGRKVFDEGVKAELVALCARSGASVSKLARECDLNANQLSRWIREHEQGRQRAVVARPLVAREAFVELPVVSTVASGNSEESSDAMSVQAWLRGRVLHDMTASEQSNVLAKLAIVLLQAAGVRAREVGQAPQGYIVAAAENGRDAKG